MRRRLFLSVLVALVLAAVVAGRAEAQARPAPLEPFVARVARLWAAGDAGGLVELAPADGRIVLDLGGPEAGAVPERHAAAALRDLFAGRETVSMRPTRVTLAGGDPPSGFGELAWVSRAQGVSDPSSAVMYVGVVWERDGWKVRELRILR